MKKIKLFLALGLMLLTLNAQAGKKIDLSKLTDKVTAQDGDTLVGSMEGPTGYKISIAKNSTVLLDNISINREKNIASSSSLGAGITCQSGGDITLIIKGNCYVTSCYVWCAGIYVCGNVTIKEHESGGKLEASGLGYGSGIGTWSNTLWPEANLTIESGTVIATGTGNSPGIGPTRGSGDGNVSTFGNITIKGGNITAIGGENGAAAGIGAGWQSECGDITITGGKVTASSADHALYGAAAIGGAHNGNCGNITFTAQAGVPIEISVSQAANAPYCIGPGTGTSTCGNLTMDGDPVGYINSSIYYYDATYIGYEGPIVWTKNLVTMEASYGLVSGYTGTSLEVPATHTDSKTREFAVTKLAGYAFDGYASLTEIILPASIKAIAQNAFDGCTGLQELKCHATVPPTLESDALNGLPKTAVIRVPNDKIDTYKAADGWKDFASQIRGLVYTAKKEIDGINYSLNLESMTATVIALDDSKKYKDTVVIPLTVKYENKEYDVKEISEDAFYENNELKGVDIPSSVENIGAHAFGYCTGLNYVICRASTTPNIQGTTFQNVNAGGQKPLFVPEASMDDYRTHDFWKEFEVRNLEVYEKRMELKGIVDEMYNLLNDGIGILTDEEMEPISVTAIPAALTVANDESSTLTQAEVDAAIATATKALNNNEAAFLTKAKAHVEPVKDDLVLMLNSAKALGANDLASTIQGQILVLQNSIKDPTTLQKVRDAYVTAKGQLNAHKSELVDAARKALIDQLSALLTADDSQECIDIIDGYIANVNAQIVWSDALTVEQNIHDNAINASVYLTQAKTELETQRAHDTKLETCDFTTKASKHSYYNDVWIYNGIWDIRGGANNNGSWEYAKMGGKKDYMADYSNVYVANKAAFSFEVKHIEVSFANGSLSKTGMSVSEWGVKVYSDDTFEDSKLLYTVKGKNEDIKKGEATVAQLVPEAGKPWLAGYGYRVYWDVANTTTTNGVVCVEKICFSNQGPATGIDQINGKMEKCENAKILRDGQLFIIRDGKTYNAQGIMVK